MYKWDILGYPAVIKPGNRKSTIFCNFPTTSPCMSWIFFSVHFGPENNGFLQFFGLKPNCLYENIVLQSRTVVTNHTLFLDLLRLSSDLPRGFLGFNWMLRLSMISLYIPSGKTNITMEKSHFF